MKDTPREGGSDTTLGGAWCTPLFDTAGQNSTGLAGSDRTRPQYGVLRAIEHEGELEIVAVPSTQADGSRLWGVREYEREHPDGGQAGPRARSARPEVSGGGFRL